MDSAADSERDSPERHRHISYCFAIKPRKAERCYDSPICLDEEKVTRAGIEYKSKRVCGGNTTCTYVHQHENPVPANSAVVNCKVKTVSSFAALERFDRLETIFRDRDFDVVKGQALISLASVQEIFGSGEDVGKIRSALSNVTAAVLRFEVGKNDIMEQILEQKLNRNFSVKRKALTKCKGYLFFKPIFYIEA